MSTDSRWVLRSSTRTALRWDLGITSGGGSETFAAGPEPTFQGGTLQFTGSGPFTTAYFLALNSLGQPVDFAIDNLKLYTTPNVSVPEPSSVALAGLAIATFGGYTWRRRKQL
jgi:hypothetical protein